ncbi:ABC transporter permease [Phyllobacterium sp. 22229]|uniref:ABC transporter permease n=1 Tax=Phyllobacterium myrsinacearum TaxID=28101 RepID=A0A2S9JQT8_9HYPH|nr:ABC transporter permease [Phyllobacterium myrsinacearum]PRD55590.1 ABC transporter permease [Phyllobacterium myrsinacearum]PWV91946.1 putative spermidine/putrescine transport system permease protein [Phyllobacterium myrsinacearum]RZV06013.1 putative spermidine/putrescine transport system permease protein [Phyllobacterium myrsinacearum]
MLLDFEKLGGLKPFLIGLTVLVCLFLILPILFIAALSFGSSQWLIFPPPSWTFKWYQALFTDPRWLYSALSSLKIAAIVTVFSVVLGFLAALGLNRGSFTGREALRALFLTPMILPVVVLAVALYALFLQFGLAGTTIAFIIAHLLIALPFSIISIGNALDGFDKSIEDAAILCGATPWEARIRVTVPAVSHGIFAAAIFSFLASWDEVVLAIFMASPTLQTLPVKIWATLRQDLTPVIAAASTILIAFTILLMVLAAFFRKGRKV